MPLSAGDARAPRWPHLALQADRSSRIGAFFEQRRAGADHRQTPTRNAKWSALGFVLLDAPYSLPRLTDEPRISSASPMTDLSHHGAYAHATL